MFLLISIISEIFLTLTICVSTKDKILIYQRSLTIYDKNIVVIISIILFIINIMILALILNVKRSENYSSVRLIAMLNSIFTKLKIIVLYFK